jgi:hypothetical protein
MRGVAQCYSGHVLIIRGSLWLTSPPRFSFYVRVDVTEEFPFPGDKNVALIRPLPLGSREEMPVNSINMPGFAAESSLYNSLTSYRSNFLFSTGRTLNVAPQLGPAWPRLRICVGNICFVDPTPIHVPFLVGGSEGGGAFDVACRVHCYSRFRNDAVQLEACLRDC